MPVTRDEVIWAYRMLLGRDPENEQMIEEQSSVENIEELRRRFLGSEEFRLAKDHDRPQVGRFLDVDSVDVEIDASPEQLQRLLDRISREWIAFGEQNPHWSVMTNDRYRASLIGEHEEEFYETGRPYIRDAIAAIRRSRPNARFARALDYGCGVGRLTLPLAEHADQVIGLDISPPHLALARERAEACGVGNATFEQVTQVDDIRKYAGQDLIISFIVLQHNPPPVIAAIIERLLNLLNPEGLAIFQVPTFFEGISFSIEHYFANEQPTMEMNAIPQNVIFEIIERTGCRVLEVREDERVSPMRGLSHTFLVERRA